MKRYGTILLLLLCFRAMAQQDHNEVLGPSQKTSDFSNISVSIKYNLQLYENYILKLTVPDEMYTSNIGGGTEQIALEKEEETHSGSNYIISFKITFLKEAAAAIDWTSPNIPLHNFKIPVNNDCVNEKKLNISFDLSATLIGSETPDLAETSVTEVVLAAKTKGDIRPGISISRGMGNATHPFYYDVILSDLSDAGVQEARFSMYYDKEDFDFITARYYSGNAYTGNPSFAYFHGDSIDVDLVGDSLIFTIENPPHSIRFRLYFRPHEGATLDVEVGALVRENALTETHGLEEETDCGNIFRYNQWQNTYTTTIPTAGIYTPSLITYFSSSGYTTCKDYCSKVQNRSILIEANNTYLSTATTKSIRVNFRKNTQINSLVFYDQYAAIPDSFQVKYKVCGKETEDSIAYSDLTGNTVALGTQNLEYLIIENIPIAARSAVDFQVNYQDNDLPNSCGLDNEFQLGFTDATLVSVASTVNINAACPLNKYVQDRYFYDTTFHAGEEGFVRIGFYPSNPNLPGLYVFDNISYTLNPKMFFTPENFKYYIGPSSNPQPADFQPYGYWGEGVSAGYSVERKPDKRELKFHNIKLNETCSTRVYFFLLAKVKTVEKVPEANYGSDIETTDPNLNAYLSTWNNSGSFLLKGNPYLYCGGQNNGNSSVRAGEHITINYTFRDDGPKKMNNFLLTLNKLYIEESADVDEMLITPEPVANLYLIDDDNATTFVRDVQITESETPIEINSELLGYHKFELRVNYTIPEGYNNIIAITSFGVKGIGGDGTPSPLVPSDTLRLTITQNYSSCSPVSCAECVSSFSPLPGKKYLLSAWVKEPLTDISNTFQNTGIKITFNNGEIDNLPLFRPDGPIIEGWQRIDQAFTVPADANNIQIELVNESTGNNAFFDDIRIHPFQSNMKSFVYDPSTQHLVAELDENNYATYYEYDDEGMLIRVKKETERGVMTIKESRNNQSKIFKNK